MKKWIRGLLICLLVPAFSACGGGGGVAQGAAESGESSYEISPAAENSETSAVESSAEASSETAEPETAGDGPRQIAVQCGENVVVYTLNDSPAADSLYAQLPLMLEVEDFSTNEKAFYPPEELDTADTPLAQAGAGTLAYYAPWGDIVMFYDDYSSNPSLYELGQAVSGGELVSGMSGTVTIAAAEDSDTQN